MARLLSYRRPGDGRVAVGELDGETVFELAAPSMLDWLRGDGRERAGTRHELVALELLAPVPEPPSVRDFFAYEGHVAAGFRRRGEDRIPAAWYEQPVFYFSNPGSIHGPSDPVRRPEGCRLLDFELEIAAVIGQGGEIAGFTLMNDWSARDIQLQEMTVGLGPAKGKDFATSLGPYLVTPDELPYTEGRLVMEARVHVNGEELSRCHADEMHFTWPELLAQAARDTPGLKPGDVLGSGTITGGSLLELGPIADGRFIEPGDTVALMAGALGRLAVQVV